MQEVLGTAVAFPSSNVSLQKLHSYGIVDFAFVCISVVLDCVVCLFSGLDFVDYSF